MTDKIINALAFAMLALPSFVLAFALAYFVGAEWKRTYPGSGTSRVGYKPGWLEGAVRPTRRRPRRAPRHDAAPGDRLAVGQIAIYMRLLRSDMIATLQEDFITMAKAKGISNRRILFRHALRPSSLTLLTVAGLNVGTLIGGAVVVEVIFGLPGHGHAHLHADRRPAVSSSCRATSR